MKPFHSKSTVEQLAEYLREEIQSGCLGDSMLGVKQLVRRLGVGTQTVVAALEVLKQKGTLEGQGERKRCKIVMADSRKKTGLQINILRHDLCDTHNEHVIDLRRGLEARGHHVEFAKKSLTELHFDVNRVARLAVKTGGDAWVIIAGSQPVLEWFAARPVPAFALFGRQCDLPIASIGAVKSPATAVALRRLVDLGHRRIVLLAREERRKPTPGLFERRFLGELERLGIETGAYNLPDWEGDSEGFHQCLGSLFRHTPPSALILGEPELFFATLQYLLGRGLDVPRDVSLISLDDHPAFEWFKPQVSLIRSETRRWIPRVLQWADNVAMCRVDRRETLTRSEFIEGGTIGSVPFLT
jgi:DNA-binding LacI/PurR family transcriptional regulator